MKVVGKLIRYGLLFVLVLIPLVMLLLAGLELFAGASLGSVAYFHGLGTGLEADVKYSVVQAVLQLIIRLIAGLLRPLLFSPILIADVIAIIFLLVHIRNAKRIKTARTKSTSLSKAPDELSPAKKTTASNALKIVFSIIMAISFLVCLVIIIAYLALLLSSVISLILSLVNMIPYDVVNSIFAVIGDLLFVVFFLLVAISLLLGITCIYLDSNSKRIKELEKLISMISFYTSK